MFFVCVRVGWQSDCKNKSDNKKIIFSLKHYCTPRSLVMSQQSSSRWHRPQPNTMICWIMCANLWNCMKYRKRWANALWIMLYQRGQCQRDWTKKRCVIWCCVFFLCVHTMQNPKTDNGINILYQYSIPISTSYGTVCPCHTIYY